MMERSMHSSGKDLEAVDAFLRQRIFDTDEHGWPEATKYWAAHAATCLQGVDDTAAVARDLLNKIVAGAMRDFCLELTTADTVKLVAYEVYAHDIPVEDMWVRITAISWGFSVKFATADECHLVAAFIDLLGVLKRRLELRAEQLRELHGDKKFYCNLKSGGTAGVADGIVEVQSVIGEAELLLEKLRR